jgi:hypothetical protein
MAPSASEPPVAIAPVPASGMIRLATRSSDRSARVVDVDGAVVLELPVDRLDRFTQIDVSRLPVGIYLVDVRGDGLSLFGRLIVDR